MTRPAISLPGAARNLGEQGPAFLHRARGEHNKMHSCQVRRERRRRARKHPSFRESPDTHVALLISAAPWSTILLSLSLSSSFVLSPLVLLFYVLESRPEVCNLAREVRGHDATRQSAYVYVRTPRWTNNLGFAKKKGREKGKKKSGSRGREAFAWSELSSDAYVFLKSVSGALRKYRGGFRRDKSDFWRGGSCKPFGELRWSTQKTHWSWVETCIIESVAIFFWISCLKILQGYDISVCSREYLILVENSCFFLCNSCENCFRTNEILRGGSDNWEISGELLGICFLKETNMSENYYKNYYRFYVLLSAFLSIA